MHKTSITLIHCINLTGGYYFIDTNDKTETSSLPEHPEYPADGGGTLLRNVDT